MNRLRRVTHKGREVILLDFTGLTSPGDWASAVGEARRFFVALPANGSALTLTDVSDTRYNREAIEMMKALTAENKPYVRAGAVVNRSTMHRAAIGMIALFARRRFEVFETREQGFDWLASQ